MPDRRKSSCYRPHPNPRWLAGARLSRQGGPSANQRGKTRLEGVRREVLRQCRLLPAARHQLSKLVAADVRRRRFGRFSWKSASSRRRLRGKNEPFTLCTLLTGKQTAKLTAPNVTQNP